MHEYEYAIKEDDDKNEVRRKGARREHRRKERNITSERERPPGPNIIYYR